MYAIANSTIITTSEIKFYFSDEEIYKEYFGEFELDKHYLCPFKVETNPSFQISFYNGRLVWRRFGLYDRPMSALDFVMIKFSLTFKQALDKCYNEIFLKRKQGVLNDVKPLAIQSQRTVKSAVKYTRDWYPYEKAYWQQYHFSKEYLESKNVFPCVGYWINGLRWHKSTVKDPLFVYMHSKDSWTGYRPLAVNKDNKFRKHNIHNHIMGYDELPLTGNHVFITSSYKDHMTLNLLGLASIAPHTERASIPKEIIEDLKSRFKYIYVVYDNDSTGVESSTVLTKTYGLNYWNVPNYLEGCKDPSDYSKDFGLDALEKNIINKLKLDGNY